MRTLANRLYVYVPLVLVALFQNFVHEGLHYLLAAAFGDGVQAVRLLTNGWGTSQVIFATPAGERIGLHWLAIAWGPAVITTLFGYLVYWQRDRWVTKLPLANLVIWYLGALFMTIDPLYYGALSWFVGGSDVNAAQVAGLPSWPFQLFALGALAINIRLVLMWREQARGTPQLYRSMQAG